MTPRKTELAPATPGATQYIVFASDNFHAYDCIV
jgi:hypothetical protein